MKYLKNIIGALLRDIVISYNNNFVEYVVKKGFLIYKSWLPFNISIGKYMFLTKKTFDKAFNK